MNTYNYRQPWQVRMRPLLASFVGAIALLCLLTGSNPAGAGSAEANAQDSRAASCGFSWEAVQSPQIPGSHWLVDIAAVSPDDVWAAGSESIPGGSQVVLEHWNGLEWTRIPPSEIDGDVTALQAISAVSANDVWAIGSSGTEGTVPVHWDGNTWSVLPGPEDDISVEDMAAVSITETWAVGYRAVDELTRAHVVHRSGNTWTTMEVPGGAYAHSRLTAVSATAAGDVWVTGYSTNQTTGAAFVARWNGSGWDSVPLPSQLEMGQTSYLSDVAAVAADDVWVAGSYLDATQHKVVLRWVGTQWDMTETPGGVNPMALAVVAPNDIWAVGTGGTTTAIRWNGLEWTAVPGPAIDSSTLTVAITAAAPNDLWVAKSRHVGLNVYGELARYGERLVAYADVAEDAEFFPYVKCLSCAEIVSGYPCGGPGEPCNANSDPYFRPGNPVTRGQLAKIVAGAAGLGGSPISQTFEDVPPGSTFHTFVENLASLQIMSGYPCGDPNEPCVEPGNRPYFRPNATASRGQLAKITANAAGITDPIPPNTQTFADVAQGSTFYLYIERLAMRDVMQGYPCGGPDEPCDSELRPYFRPGNMVTRGQTAKIVSNTFFPGCE